MMEPTPELVEAIRRDKIEAAKRMSLEEKFLAGGNLFEAVTEGMRAGIRMQHPEASEDEVLSMLRHAWSSPAGWRTACEPE